MIHGFSSAFQTNNAQVLVDAAYETKRIRSMLAENMAARMSLESQRREEMIVYNRELREKATAQKAKVGVDAWYKRQQITYVEEYKQGDGIASCPGWNHVGVPRTSIDGQFFC